MREQLLPVPLQRPRRLFAEPGSWRCAVRHRSPLAAIAKEQRLPACQTDTQTDSGTQRSRGAGAGSRGKETEDKTLRQQHRSRKTAGQTRGAGPGRERKEQAGPLAPRPRPQPEPHTCPSTTQPASRGPTTQHPGAQTGSLCSRGHSHPTHVHCCGTPSPTLDKGP